MTRLLEIKHEELWKAVDDATSGGAGTKTLNLSPHGSILAALFQQRGPGLFEPLASAWKGRLFVPLEIELPALGAQVMARIVRPPG